VALIGQPGGQTNCRVAVSDLDRRFEGHQFLEAPALRGILYYGVAESSQFYWSTPTGFETGEIWFQVVSALPLRRNYTIHIVRSLEKHRLRD